MELVLFYGVPEGSSFESIVALEWLGQPYRLCRINCSGSCPSSSFPARHEGPGAPAGSLAGGQGRELAWPKAGEAVASNGANQTANPNVSITRRKNGR